MKTPAKLLLLMIVALILAVPVVIMSRASVLIRDAIQDYGSALVGAPVSLGTVTFSLINGEAELKKLVIGNPQGFKSDHSFSIDAIRIKLEPLSVFSDLIEIEEIIVDDPNLIWEAGKGGSNIQAIRKNLPAADSGEASEGGLLVMIDHFYLNGAIVAIEGLPVGRDRSLVLPDLHLQGIGRNEAGVTFGIAAEQVFAIMIPAIYRVAMSQQVQGLANRLKIDLESGGKPAADKLEGKLRKGLKRGLGGLFRRGKEEEGEEKEGGN